MKRIILVVKEVEKCLDCPFYASDCREEDDNDFYINYCDKWNMKETYEFTDESIEKENNDVKEWFDKKCRFEKL